jgi:hypothetical protein
LRASLWDGRSLARSNSVDANPKEALRRRNLVALENVVSLRHTSAMVSSAKEGAPLTTKVSKNLGGRMRISEALLSAAVSGIFLGASSSAMSSPRTTPGVDSPTYDQLDGSSDAGAKHACKGQNACKSQGGCKTDKHACKGQNECKGQGGCRTDGKKM